MWYYLGELSHFEQKEPYHGHFWSHKIKIVLKKLYFYALQGYAIKIRKNSKGREEKWKNFEGLYLRQF